MKAIIQSYTPQECERIINGRQTIKVCKTVSEDTPFKVYMYCTKDGYAYRCRIDENGKLRNRRRKLAIIRANIKKRHR